MTNGKDPGKKEKQKQLRDQIIQSPSKRNDEVVHGVGRPNLGTKGQNRNRGNKTKRKVQRRLLGSGPSNLTPAGVRGKSGGKARES